VAGGAAGGAPAGGDSDSDTLPDDTSEAVELKMDADDEWWGESAIVPVIQALAASGPTEISIDALLTLLPSYLPRLAVDLVLRDLHHNQDMQSQVHCMYYDGILHIF